MLALKALRGDRKTMDLLRSRPLGAPRDRVGGVSDCDRRRHHELSVIVFLVGLGLTGRLALTPSSGHLTRENAYHGKITSGVHS
jgi:hypothetical protein